MPTFESKTESLNSKAPTNVLTPPVPPVEMLPRNFVLLNWKNPSNVLSTAPPSPVAVFVEKIALLKTAPPLAPLKAIAPPSPVDALLLKVELFTASDAPPVTRIAPPLVDLPPERLRSLISSVTLLTLPLTRKKRKSSELNRVKVAPWPFTTTPFLPVPSGPMTGRALLPSSTLLVVVNL